jgi:hypothetical protein
VSIRPGAARINDEMKRYLLTIYQPDGPRPPPEVLGPIMRDVDALVEEARSTGVWVFNGALHDPSTATVVRLREGEPLVTDGPYVEGKEHVGGFLIVQAPDLDAALGWAHRLARTLAPLPIEVRPFRDRD